MGITRPIAKRLPNFAYNILKSYKEPQAFS